MWAQVALASGETGQARLGNLAQLGAVYPAVPTPYRYLRISRPAFRRSAEEQRRTMLAACMTPDARERREWGLGGRRLVAGAGDSGGRPGSQHECQGPRLHKISSN